MSYLYICSEKDEMCGAVKPFFYFNCLISYDRKNRG